MRHLLCSFLCFLALLFVPHANAQPRSISSSDPTWAVVQIPSHGCSATVIATAPGRTLLLSCSHAFEGKDAAKRITLDMPAPAAGPAKNPGVRLIAVDYRLDLSLIEVNDGPVPYVCPVADGTYNPTGRVLSAGYDEMRKTADGRPSVVKDATIVAVSGNTTYTREIPWHGRSGGALIGGGYLVGVVQGYEVSGPRRGMYVSHRAILAFLANPSPPTRSADPYYRQDCPNGNCPIRRYP